MVKTVFDTNLPPTRNFTLKAGRGLSMLGDLQGAITIHVSPAQDRMLTFDSAGNLTVNLQKLAESEDLRTTVWEAAYNAVASGGYVTSTYVDNAAARIASGAAVATVNPVSAGLQAQLTAVSGSIAVMPTSAAVSGIAAEITAGALVNYPTSGGAAEIAHTVTAAAVLGFTEEIVSIGHIVVLILFAVVEEIPEFSLFVLLGLYRLYGSKVWDTAVIAGRHSCAKHTAVGCTRLRLTEDRFSGLVETDDLGLHIDYLLTGLTENGRTGTIIADYLGLGIHHLLTGLTEYRGTGLVISYKLRRRHHLLLTRLTVNRHTGLVIADYLSLRIAHLLSAVVLCRHTCAKLLVVSGHISRILVSIAHRRLTVTLIHVTLRRLLHRLLTESARIGLLRHLSGVAGVSGLLRLSGDIIMLLKMFLSGHTLICKRRQFRNIIIFVLINRGIVYSFRRWQR